MLSALNLTLKHRQHSLLFFNEYHMAIQTQHHKAAIISLPELTKLVY